MRQLFFSGVLLGVCAIPAFAALPPLPTSPEAWLVPPQANTYLGTYGKTAVAVIFLSAVCPCSRSHEAAVAELARQFPEVTFLGVNSNQNEPLPLSRDYFARAALPFPVLRDDAATLADSLGAFKTPHAFLLEAKGNVLFSGGVDDSQNAATARTHYLREALQDLRAGRKIQRAEARALGCVIARKP